MGAGRRDSEGFTPTERRLFDLLNDGQLHSVEELHGCLPNGDTAVNGLHAHISNLRRNLTRFNKAIVTISLRDGVSSTFYRLVNLSESDF